MWEMMTVMMSLREIGLSRDLRSLKHPTLARPSLPPAVPTHSTWKLFCMQIQALCSIFYVSQWRASSLPDWEFCAGVHFGVTFNDCQQFWTCTRIFESPELAQIANSSGEKSCEMWKVLFAKSYWLIVKMFRTILWISMNINSEEVKMIKSDWEDV